MVRMVVRGRSLGLMVWVRGRRRRQKGYVACRIKMVAATGGW